MKKFIIIIILLIGFSAFAQGPWTQKKGKFYTQISFTTIPNYNTLFGNPDYSVRGRISDHTLQFYNEYGLSSKTTLLINVPYKFISNKGLVNPCLVAPCPEYSNKENTLGNIEIGIKHNFYKKKWLISGQFSMEADTGSFDINSGIRTGYNAFTFTPLFIAGKSFENNYLQTFIGTRIRTNKYSSNFKVGGEYGSKVTKNIWIIGFLDIEKSFKNGTVILPNSNLSTGLYVNNQEYGVVGVKAIGEFSNNFGITASLPAALFGNNVAKQVALSFGVYHKF
tara:strand:- start:6504 stop:7343 length:840 start_codon:yes stop_codon:yes gene_type:complete